MNTIFTSLSPVPQNLPHVPNSPKKDYGKWQLVRESQMYCCATAGTLWYRRHSFTHFQWCRLMLINTVVSRKVVLSRHKSVCDKRSKGIISDGGL